MVEDVKRTFTNEEMMEACRQYRREWRKKNPHKQAEYQRRYILKKAAKLQAEMEAKEGKNDAGKQ